MNGFAFRTAGRAATAALALLSVGCTASSAFRPTYASSPMEGSVTKVTYKDGVSALGGPSVAAPAAQAAVVKSSGTTITVQGSNVVGSDCNSCGCGDYGCRGRCGHRSLKDKLHDCDWEQLRTDHCWPEQYNFESRRRVHQPLHDQIASGHATHNSIFDAHFETKPDMRTVLNDAGKSRLAYLARRKPYVVPSVFVQTTFDPVLDEKRNQNVREFLNTVSTEPTDWQVVSANSTPTGLYGAEGANAINKMIGPRMGANVPTPYYERILKNNFFLGTGGGQETTGGGGS